VKFDIINAAPDLGENWSAPRWRYCATHHWVNWELSNGFIHHRCIGVGATCARRARSHLVKYQPWSRTVRALCVSLAASRKSTVTRCDVPIALVMKTYRRSAVVDGRCRSGRVEVLLELRVEINVKKEWCRPE